MGLHGRARFKPGGDRFDDMSWGDLLAEMMGHFVNDRIDDYASFYNLQSAMNETECREWVRAHAGK